jgi:hypothetical protein
VALSLLVLAAAVGSCVDGLGGRREPVRLAAEQAGATVSSGAEAAPPATAPPTTRARLRASTPTTTSTMTSTAPPTTARVKATTPPTTRRPRPTTTRPPAGCHPSYSGCLRIGIGDYDCASGSGNGPNYVDGPVRVRGIDPFDLDRDGDGWGCDG